eukprot:CAMPEP_0174309580 /NCGR_PEP_ID=MMETSP0810-20121108/2502_1 /TAXON_ID=73025 ORGANISM="Eutreptiella gymnastica-like, Strain CCMP1594" /NCGR_SAMPLE_ID=MMETSP0810 /ASSEMBLY_ACC=CAM_ASM_000659 /LENGTH=63 /DNA_ID=CAMNT_0015417255 /DNA_START=1342 /DNA_END=1533 /DNA_ORIENTATION=+
MCAFMWIPIRLDGLWQTPCLPSEHCMPLGVMANSVPDSLLDKGGGIKLFPQYHLSSVAMGPGS